jgi:mono/diheme cytochrome c family protein
MRLASFVTLVVLALTTVGPATAEGQTAGEPAVSFIDHIRSIFERTCWNCHGAASQLSALDLRTRDGALEGGSRRAALVPGRAEESRLFRMVAGLDEPAMPMGKDGLTPPEIAALRAWIDDGAHWDEGGSTSATAAPEDAELPPGARD